MDYYKILNLSRNATYDEINEAFKIYAPMYIINSKKNLTFTYLCQAYEILSDKNLRKKYDNGEKIHINFTDPHTVYQHVLYPQSGIAVRFFCNRYPLYNDLLIHDSIETSRIFRGWVW